MVKFIAVMVLFCIVAMADAGCLLKGRVGLFKGRGACGASATATTRTRAVTRERGFFRGRGVQAACAAEAIAPPQAPPVKK